MIQYSVFLVRYSILQMTATKNIEHGILNHEVLLNHVKSFNPVTHCSGFFITSNMPSQLLKLVVTNPCHENWDNMQPVKNGRHCGSCQKDVIDFSVMNNEDVQNYFLKNQHGGICGRFKNTQLEKIRINIPVYVFQKKINPWKKYLLILLLCFGSTVFSVDVFIGNGNLYAQTQKKNTHSKQKKKKKKLTWNNYILFPTVVAGSINTIDCSTTTGFTVTKPDEPIPGVPIEKWETLEEKLTMYKKINAGSHALAINSTTNDKGKPSKKSEPVDKMEFILPAPLAIRKRLVKS
ncbi:MAG: hypothetical protein ABUL44_00460 [Flavobacterium sp.]